MNLKFIILAVCLLIGSFTELVVFNEEILLAFCFIAFVFFAYSFLSDTVFSISDDRAKKFESDIIFAFESKYLNVKSYADELVVSKKTLNAILFFETFMQRYASFGSKFAKGAHSSTLLSLTETKLNEIILTEQKLKTFTQKVNIQNVLFPVVFNLAKRIKNPKLVL